MRIDYFLFDEENEAKFASHGISVQQVYEVLLNAPVVVRNRKDRRASHLVIGIDSNGYCLAIPITPTYESTVWQPVTAWYCKESEQALLSRRQ